MAETTKEQKSCLIKMQVQVAIVSTYESTRPNSLSLWLAERKLERLLKKAKSLGLNKNGID